MNSYVNLSSRIAGIFSKGDNSVNLMSFFLFLDWVTHMDSYVNLSSRIAGIFSKGDNSVNFVFLSISRLGDCVSGFQHYCSDPESSISSVWRAWTFGSRH